MKDRPDTPAELKARALRHLVWREHSRAELARKLAPHADSSDSVQALLNELESRKQLCDERFAEQRVHVMARKYGAAKIRQDLEAKGVDPVIIERISREGELERAAAILERKYRSPATSREERARRARFLQGRGFSYDVIHRLVSSKDPD
jgi:regulatory protein